MNVILKGKLQHYCGEQGFTPDDLIDAYDLFEKPPAPSRVIHPLIAFAFLTPLNEFLRQAGCMPKFVLFLNKELAHSAVKKLCGEQGENFPLSAKALVKALAEEGLIKTTPSGNTVSLRYCERNLRYMALDKQKAQAVLCEEQ